MVSEQAPRQWPAGLTPGRIVVVVSVFIVLYFGTTAVGNYFQRAELDQYRQRLRGEITGLETQQGRLSALAEYMQTDEFIERSAREEGLVRPGDTAVIVAAPGAGGDSRALSGPWWERYFAPETR